MKEAKKNLRNQILSKRSMLSPSDVYRAGEAALDKLTKLPEYKAAETVMLYVDFRNEVPTGKLIEHVLQSGKKLILPLTNKSFEIIPFELKPANESIQDLLVTSSFGVSEPDPEKCTVIDPKTIDLVIIPGSVFDKSFNRIGYGKGCYDRFLPKLRNSAAKVALAYDFQILDSIPTGATDVKMDSIVEVPIIEG